MNKLRHITFLLAALSLWLILSSWGSVGHRKINEHAPASFPAGLNFLRASWTTILADNASVADDRKQWDNSESPKHYIDIDNYNEFNQTGKIPMTLDSVKNIYGISFVLSNGTVPWATIATFDSIKACFQRNDFGKASLFAADLGHYVADGHQPFHITKNYDGQSTGQNGIHSRYETRLIGNYSSSIIYPDDTAQFINDVPGYIFTYLYHNYQYIDSVLLADQYAQSVAGNTNSSTYYQTLWARTGTFTTELFRRASYSLASLIYTAWVEAGKPNGIAVLSQDPPVLGQNVPNPFSDRTIIPVQINYSNQKVTLKVYDSAGKIVTTLFEGKMSKGTHQVIWDASGSPAGVYYYVLHSGDSVLSRKMILVK